ncbi:MAG TPA: ASCH domain-containing protein [Acidimicrobiales bacterium]|jgi:hypothetical protein|nr:ASCH domain-containing protein [Acidimicrobiales bacterium]
MKALTVRQPWASLIMAGDKDVENRSFATTHRGRLAIHAAARPDPEGLASHAHLLDSDYPLAAVLGTVVLVDVVRGHHSEWAIPDCWHWVLADPEPLADPVPLDGQQGLWDLDLDHLVPWRRG